MPLNSGLALRWEEPEQAHRVSATTCPDIIGVGCPVCIVFHLFAGALVNFAKVQFAHRDAVFYRADIDT